MGNAETDLRNDIVCYVLVIILSRLSCSLFLLFFFEREKDGGV